MRSKVLFSSLIYSLIGVLLLLQVNAILAFASDLTDPITSAITGFIGSDPTPTPSPSATPTPTPSATPVPTSDPITSPITIEKYIRIISPNGGENYKAGETMKIEWTSSNLSQCIIKLAYEDGTFSTKWVPVNPELNYYNWVIGNQDLSGKDSQQAKINMQCYDASSNGYNNESDSFFTINSSSPITSPITDPTPTPSPTPSATPAPEQHNDNSNSGRNDSPAQAPVCVDAKPASAPKLLSASANGKNQVTLTWSKAADPVTYYLVAYGTKSGKLEFGNPNVGGKNATSYTVKGLENGKTYFFKVRAGNHCMPGEFSNELSVKVTGDNIGNKPASGFKAGVLGSTEKQDLEFKPITSAKPTHITGGVKNLLNRIWISFTNFFKR